MNQNKTYYDDFSSWYENERGHGYHAMIDALELSIITPLVKDKSVLEVGCGTGLLMKELKDDAREIKGVDISPGMLEKAIERKLDVQEGSVEDLPFEDNSFDVVYSFKVLAHVKNIEKAMEEMNRVLKPGGILLAEFYNSLSLRCLSRFAGGAKKISEKRTEADVFTRWDTPRQVKEYIPFGMVFEGWRGVRVFTPFAGAYNLKPAQMVLAPAERWAVNSPLARFGGFLVAQCRKSTHP